MSDSMAAARLLAKVLTCSVTGSSTAPARTRAAQPLTAHLLIAHGFDVVECNGSPPMAPTTSLTALTETVRGLRRARRRRLAAPVSRLATRRPRARSAVIEREAPGLAEAMRLCNPLGRLSRGVAGIRGHDDHRQHARAAPRAVSSSSAAVLDVLPHALRLLHDADNSH